MQFERTINNQNNLAVVNLQLNRLCVQFSGTISEQTQTHTKNHWFVLIVDIRMHTNDPINHITVAV